MHLDDMTTLDLRHTIIIVLRKNEINDLFVQFIFEHFFNESER